MEQPAGRRADEATAFMTGHDPNPNLFESQMAMVGRMGRTGSPRRRIAARVFAGLAVLPFLVGAVRGVIWLVREIV